MTPPGPISPAEFHEKNLDQSEERLGTKFCPSAAVRLPTAFRRKASRLPIGREALLVRITKKAEGIATV
jgi:hypothetical protein